MTYLEADLRPLSALQHLLFCERQCALIHVEQVWAENRWTAEGNLLHKKAHVGKPETRDGVRIIRGLPLRSLSLGLSGQADVVTWEPRVPLPPGRSLAAALRQAIQSDLTDWIVTPVEYKRGKPKQNRCDEVQLCAQALCLEEMLSTNISSGQIFYGKQRRRYDVPFDSTLRELTRQTALRLHQLLSSGTTPTARYEKKCDTCSLLMLCMPKMLQRQARAYIDRQLQECEIS